MAKFYLSVVLAISPGFAYGAPRDMTLWDFLKGLYEQTIGEGLVRDKIDRKKNRSPHWNKVSSNKQTWGSEFFWGLTDQGLQHIQEHGMPQERDFYIGSIILFQNRGVDQVGIARLMSRSSERLSVRAPDLFPKTHESPDYSRTAAPAVRAVALATPPIMGMVWFRKDAIAHLHVYRNMSKVWPVPDTWSDWLWGTVVVGFSDGRFLVRLGGMLDSEPVNGEPLKPRPLSGLPNWGRQEGETAALAIINEDKLL